MREKKNCRKMKEAKEREKDRRKKTEEKSKRERRTDMKDKSKKKNLSFGSHKTISGTTALLISILTIASKLLFFYMKCSLNTRLNSCLMQRVTYEFILWT